MNFVFVLMDAVRADHLPHNGYHLETAPFIETLAEESLTAEACYAQNNTTEPGMSTMQTGRYPSEHGVLGQDHPAELPRDMPTLFEVLREAGYDTFGVSFTSKALERGVPQLHRIEDTQQVTQAGIEAAGEMEEPWAMFLHYMTAHGPFSCPQQYLEWFYHGDPTEGIVQRDREALTGPTPRPREMQAEIDEGVEPEYFSAKYDGAIRYLDDNVRRLHEELVDGRDTAMLVTADHGESLTEHGIYFGHRGLYEPSVRVPFVLDAPTVEAGEVDDFVEHVDYPETVCELLDVDPPETSGESVLDREGKERAVFVENTWNSARGVRVGDWKYVEFHGQVLHDADPRELYHLGNDPEELRNVVQRWTDAREDLVAHLDQHRREVGAADEDPVVVQETTLPDDDPSEEVKERLGDLGYI